MFARISRALANLARWCANGKRVEVTAVGTALRNLDGNFLKIVTGRQTFATACGGLAASRSFISKQIE
jgi:hypothetical protein